MRSNWFGIHILLLLVEALLTEVRAFVVETFPSLPLQDGCNIDSLSSSFAVTSCPPPAAEHEEVLFVTLPTYSRTEMASWLTELSRSLL